MTDRPLRLTVLALALGLSALTLVGCGSSAPGFSASCSLAESSYGPFGPDQTYGSTLTEAQAIALTEDAGFASWIEITASGNWDFGWDEATSSLGPQIHQQLAWIDVAGHIDGLYRTSDSYSFDELRVSRSFQGKIEHDRTGIFAGIPLGASADLENASCSVSEIRVTDETSELVFNMDDLGDQTTFELAS